MAERQIDRRKLIVALAALLVVIAAAFGLSLTSLDNGSGESADRRDEEQREAIEDACASRATFQGLKLFVFEQAGQRLTGDRVNFDILAASAFVRMENPVVASRDEGLNLTRCTGEFILELPPGAETGFGGQRRLTADVAYEVQDAADGSGPVYRMTGAETIVSRLAAFDMEGRRLQPPPAALPEDPFANQAMPEPFPDPEADETPPAPVAANPSFDCRSARTRGEMFVCASDSLAALDRSMAALYASAMDDAGRQTRRRLVRTRDNFLAYRDRCRDDACVAQAYDGRMREIRDIMAEAD